MAKRQVDDLRQAALRSSYNIISQDFVEKTSLLKMAKTIREMYKSVPSFKLVDLRHSLRRVGMQRADDIAYLDNIVNPLVKRYGEKVRPVVVNMIVTTGGAAVFTPKTNFKELARRCQEGGLTETFKSRLYQFLDSLRLKVSNGTHIGTWEGDIVDNFKENGLSDALKMTGYALVRADGNRNARMTVASAVNVRTCSCCNEPFPKTTVTEIWYALTDARNICHSCRSQPPQGQEELGARFRTCAATRRNFVGSDDAEDPMFALELDGLGWVWKSVAIEMGLLEQENGEWFIQQRIPSHHRTLAGYHGAPRQWKENPGAVPKGAIGVELECGFKGGETGRDDFLRRHLRATGQFARFPMVVEADGSLGNVPGGCEIISEPLPFFEGYVAENAPWRRFLKLLYESGAEGWKWRDQAGIHVNVDMRDADDETRLKFVAFINNCAALSKFLSGRGRLYGRQGAIDGKQKSSKTMYKGGYEEMDRNFLKGYKGDIKQAYIDFATRNGKYSPVNLRGRRDGVYDCFEVRIFGSNIKYEGFMACVEYCVAVKEFVQTIHLMDVFSATMSSEFRNWLGTKLQTYPNLGKRLGIVERQLGAAVPADKKVAAELAAA